jgi:drug/metabolite transporter (DMT)-like permease
MKTPPADSRSVVELLRDLASDSSTLLRQELQLARTETENKVHQSIAALVAMIAGALVGFAGLIVLLDALVYGLTEAGLDHWLASLIVGGVVALVGYVLVRKGQKYLSATRLAPERSAANFRKDVDLLREQMS